MSELSCWSWAPGDDVEGGRIIANVAGAAAPTCRVCAPLQLKAQRLELARGGTVEPRVHVRTMPTKLFLLPETARKNLKYYILHSYSTSTRSLLTRSRKKKLIWIMTRSTKRICHLPGHQNNEAQPGSICERRHGTAIILARVARNDHRYHARNRRAP